MTKTQRGVNVTKTQSVNVTIDVHESFTRLSTDFTS